VTALACLGVIAGLDPAIHHSSTRLPMDARVKAGHDPFQSKLLSPFAAQTNSRAPRR
jgi:hypothetical protein